MRRQRRNFSGPEQMAILREYLIDKVEVVFPKYDSGTDTWSDPPVSPATESKVWRFVWGQGLVLRGSGRGPSSPRRQEHDWRFGAGKWA